MRLKPSAWLITIATMILGITACQIDENDNGLVPASAQEAQQPLVAVVRLGDKLQNPYTVANMQEALANLQANSRTASDPYEIAATHHYVRFLPSDSVDVDVLSDDDHLELYDYPLDYELVQGGDFYHDPELAEDQVTWQYTVVPVGYQFPNIQYEIIDDLFMIEEDRPSSGSRMALSNWYELEEEALRITGNWEGGSAGSRASEYFPKGYIKVQRNFNAAGARTIDTVGVAGVKVRARYFVKIKSDHTDANGFFQITTGFRNEVHYSIEWETDDYKITNGVGFSINFEAKDKQKKDWNPVFAFGASDVHWAAATMLNAIYAFKKQASTEGLKQASGLGNIKIRPIFDSKASNVVNGSFKHYGAVPFIVGGPIGLGAQVVLDLALRNDVRFFLNGFHHTGNIHQTMMHELGHMSHILKSPVNFQTSYLADPMVVESWGTAVEYYFTMPYYPTLAEGLPKKTKTRLNAGGTLWQYTPFFIDLRDTQNQRIDLPKLGLGDSSQFANDAVSGYTLIQMQNALDSRTTLKGVQEYLINNYSNSSEGKIEEMRRFYEAIKQDNK